MPILFPTLVPFYDPPHKIKGLSNNPFSEVHTTIGNAIQPTHPSLPPPSLWKRIIVPRKLAWEGASRGTSAIIFHTLAIIAKTLPLALGGTSELLLNRIAKTNTNIFPNLDSIYGHALMILKMMEGSAICFFAGIASPHYALTYLKSRNIVTAGDDAWFFAIKNSIPLNASKNSPSSVINITSRSNASSSTPPNGGPVIPPPPGVPPPLTKEIKQPVILNEASLALARCMMALKTVTDQNPINTLSKTEKETLTQLLKNINILHEKSSELLKISPNDKIQAQALLEATTHTQTWLNQEIQELEAKTAISAQEAFLIDNESAMIGKGVETLKKKITKAEEEKILFQKKEIYSQLTGIIRSRIDTIIGLPTQIATVFLAIFTKKSTSIAQELHTSTVRSYTEASEKFQHTIETNTQTLKTLKSVINDKQGPPPDSLKAIIEQMEQLIQNAEQNHDRAIDTVRNISTLADQVNQCQLLCEQLSPNTPSTNSQIETLQDGSQKETHEALLHQHEDQIFHWKQYIEQLKLLEKFKSEEDFSSRDKKAELEVLVDTLQKMNMHNDQTVITAYVAQLQELLTKSEESD